MPKQKRPCECVESDDRDLVRDWDSACLSKPADHRGAVGLIRRALLDQDVPLSAFIFSCHWKKRKCSLFLRHFEKLSVVSESDPLGV